MTSSLSRTWPTWRRLPASGRASSLFRSSTRAATAPRPVW